jgi:hypothetical protein
MRPLADCARFEGVHRCPGDAAGFVSDRTAAGHAMHVSLMQSQSQRLCRHPPPSTLLRPSAKHSAPTRGSVCVATATTAGSEQNTCRGAEAGQKSSQRL